VRGGLRAVPAHQLSRRAGAGHEVVGSIAADSGATGDSQHLASLCRDDDAIVQATSLGTLIGVTEFMRTGQSIVDRVTVMEGWNPAFAVYAGVLLVYFLICSLVSAWGRHLERRATHERTRHPTPEDEPLSEVSATMLKVLNR